MYIIAFFPIRAGPNIHVKCILSVILFPIFESLKQGGYSNTETIINCKKIFVCLITDRMC